MLNENLGIIDLKSALDDIKERFPRLQDDDLFVLWFLRAFITDKEEFAAEAIVDGAGDKGIDAIIIDDNAKAVFVVQGKHREQLMQKTESRADVLALAEVASRMFEKDEKEFKNYVASMDAHAAAKVKKARQRLKERGYKLWLNFLTLGKVSTSVRNDATSLLKAMKSPVVIDFIDGKRAMLILRDYLDGVAPPIPSLELEMENSAQVRVNGISQRYDDANKIECWVFSMRGDKIAELFQHAGIRLFARNVRGFLGETTAINKGMEKTLGKEPDRFFYYNNGVTILCDEAEGRKRDGKDFLQVGNPQVINGQQTTRTLSNNIGEAAKASVLVKVIRVERGHGDARGFDTLVSRIVAGTNWQNAIRASDLMSNDRIQIELERALRKIGYAYLRKRQTKGEAKEAHGGKHFRYVKKEEFAQAVAACEIDPILARTAKEKLFSEEYYKRVFPNSDPNFYLPRYLLAREVFRLAKQKNKTDAKWLVLNYVWSKLSPHITKKTSTERFRILMEKHDPDLRAPLVKAIERILVTAGKFFQENKGIGDDRVDMPTFFKSKRSSTKQFNVFWNDNPAETKKLEPHIRRLVAAINEP
ncbi:MAG: AIPR family protein [Planctomycetes bacterium]|nr:AIPR family protein [Planctomycetota bacterium]